MEEVLRTSNPGLARRFRPDDAFMFEDYDNDALRVILQNKAAASGVEVPPDAADAAVAMLARQRQKPKFGNGGAVDNLLNRAKEALAARVAAAAAAGAPLGADMRATLLRDDFDREPPAAPEDALKHLVGAPAARAKLEELRAAVASAQASGADPWSSVEPCFVFKGPPGCVSHVSCATCLHACGLTCWRWCHALLFSPQMWQDHACEGHGPNVLLSWPALRAERRRKDGIHSPDGIRRPGTAAGATCRALAAVAGLSVWLRALVDSRACRLASRSAPHSTKRLGESSLLTRPTRWPLRGAASTTRYVCACARVAVWWFGVCMPPSTLVTPVLSFPTTQIVTEIVACLTHPKYKNKLIVIMAGYDEPVRHGCCCGIAMRIPCCNYCSRAPAPPLRRWTPSWHPPIQAYRRASASTFTWKLSPPQRRSSWACSALRLLAARSPPAAARRC
jgi:hypothetical protein